MQKTRVQSLGQEDPLEEEVTTHSNILAWEIQWTEEPGGLTLHKVGLCPSLNGKVIAELRPIRCLPSLTYSRSLHLHGK